MRDRGEATTADDFPNERGEAHGRSPLVQRAPGPETPDVRDKAAAKRGMIIILAVCGGFWAAVAAGAVLLLR